MSMHCRLSGGDAARTAGRLAGVGVASRGLGTAGQAHWRGRRGPVTEQTGTAGPRYLSASGGAARSHCGGAWFLLTDQKVGLFVARLTTISSPLLGDESPVVVSGWRLSELMTRPHQPTCGSEATREP